MEESIKVYVLLKTQSKKCVMELTEYKDSEISYLLLKIINQYFKKNSTVIQYDCCDVCHILTKNHNNTYQYLLPLYEKLETLLNRQTQKGCDKEFIYLQISERHFPYVMKYQNSDKNEIDKVKNVSLRDFFEINRLLKKSEQDDNIKYKDYFHVSDDPFSNCINEMRSTYPLSSRIPQQLINKHFNVFLDAQNCNFSIKIIKKPPITPTAVNPNVRVVTEDTYLLQIIARLPLWLSYILYPVTFLLLLPFQFVEQLLHSPPYFYPSRNPQHRKRTVQVIQIPLFPHLFKIVFKVIFQTIVYVGFSMMKVTIRNIQYVFWILLSLHISFMLIYQCYSFLPLNLVILRNKHADPTGQLSLRFHYIYDELFRADNQYWNFGTFNRNQCAANFRSLKLIERPIKQFHKSFGYILLEFLKSLDPDYQIPQ